MRQPLASTLPGPRSIFSVRWFQFLLGGLLALLVTVVLVPHLAERGLARISGAVVLEPVSAASPGDRPETSAPPANAARGGEAPAASATGPVYRVQVGAFAEPADAERLAERLEREGLQVSGGVVTQPRWRYRVFIASSGDPILVGTLRALGLTAEPDGEGIRVRGLLLLRRAVEVARRLAAGGFEARLLGETITVTLHVVEIGGFATYEEAERARAELAGRGLDGVVVLEGS